MPRRRRSLPQIDRASVMLFAIVEHPGGVESRHRVRDVSGGGIRIDEARDFQPGERVIVSVGALRHLVAQVRWVREGCAGLAFAARVDPADARKKPGALPAPSIPLAARHDTAGIAASGWIGDLRDAYRG